MFVLGWASLLTIWRLAGAVDLKVFKSIISGLLFAIFHPIQNIVMKTCCVKKHCDL
jgi:hypothetical protein